MLSKSFIMPEAVAVVGDEIPVGSDVRAELLNRFQERSFVRRILFDRLEIVVEVFKTWIILRPAAKVVRATERAKTPVQSARKTALDFAQELRLVALEVVLWLKVVLWRSSHETALGNQVMKLRLVEIQQSILRKNDDLARALRGRFAATNTLVVNLLSSPGSGKTTLLEATLAALGANCRVGALVGDQATRNDADRLQRSGAPVRQITTAAECRLDADMIGKALAGWDALPLDVLFIENVGNLICPAEYDLGEDLRVVLTAVTEGEDKPLKYPLAFHTSHVALITKIDIGAAVGFDRDAAYDSIRRVNGDIEILELACRTGVGLNAWYTLLERRLAAKKARFVPA